MLWQFRAVTAFVAALMAMEANADDSIRIDRLESICLVTSDDHDASRRFERCEKLIAHVRGKLKVGDIHGIRACIPEKVSKEQRNVRSGQKRPPTCCAPRVP